ncbi:hypothetical protein [Oceanirhabdus sp. W0125-5]|nr:hypothetical protein [Oceanirhabdus sp. W0125-5]WBW95143.1 hypothetical protein OW730_15780 [Oceanirhabdus sp. W0125-5]
MISHKKIRLFFVFIILMVVACSISSCKSESKKTIEVLEISSAFNYEINS